MSEAIIKNPPIPNNYGTEFLCFDRGENSTLYDISGKSYIDFAAGIAVNALGYKNDRIIKVATEQLKKIMHTSNLFTTRPVLELAELITAASPLTDKKKKERTEPYFTAVHFGNSGTEANEAALKYARIYAKRSKKDHGTGFLALENCFHGRTMGALSVTYSKKYKDPVAPLIDGTDFIPMNDISALEASDPSKYAAFILEPIQGEGGLRQITKDYAEAVNTYCRNNDIILIADEVQSGIGRCGTIFASEQFGLEPDIITLSKPLAGGLPLSATLLPKKINDLVQVGDHGSTFGGGPVQCAVAAEIWKVVIEPGFLGQVKLTSNYFETKLDSFVDEFDFIEEQRGRGMLRGLALKNPEGLPTLIQSARDQGLIVLRSGTNILRMAPPLTIDHADLDKGLGILHTVLSALK
jgi:acetylornithine/N-succinyldiaminopimelate aminotransferase